MYSLNKVYTLAVLLTLSFTACASPRTSSRYFFPPLPNDPKIEYVGIYSGLDDFPDREKSILQTMAGDVSPQVFKKPAGIATDGKGRVYVSDPNQSALIGFDFNSKSIFTVGTEGLLITPFGVTVDEKGRIYVSDTQNNEVYVFDKDNRPLFNLGKGTTNWPTGIVVNNKRGLIYVVNSHGHNVTVYSLAGKYLFSFGERGRGEGTFNFPLALAINSKEEIIVADSINALIQIFSYEGRFLRQFGRRGDADMDFEIIKGVAVDSNDNMYVTDSKAHKVLIFSPEGTPLLRFDGRFFVPEGEGGSVHGGFLLPAGIAIDKDDKIYIADSWNRRFHVYQYLNEEQLKKNPVSASGK